MSLSSEDSFIVDEDNIIAEGNEEIDYYALLNVPRNASLEEINKAYKHRSLIFHPDRHVDEEDKKDASKIFVLLRQAQQTLSDSRLRSVYDTVGARGLEMQGWQLIQRSSNSENIRKEYEFLKKLRENEIMLQRVHPASNFVLKITAVGLFQENSNERYLPQVMGMNLSQSVDCTMASKDKVALVGRVRNNFHNGSGEGSLIASWRRSVSTTLHLENSLSLSQDSVGFSTKISKTVGQKALIILQPSFNYIPLLEQFSPALMLLYTMQLRPNWQGTIAFNCNPHLSSLTTSIVKTELNQPKFLLNITLSPVNSNMRFVHNKRYSENDFHIESACTLGFMGIAPSVSVERKLSRYSKIGASLSFSFPTCLLQAKFKLKTSLSNYEVHIVLCDNPDDIARSTIFGFFFPFLITSAVKVMFRKPLARFMRIFKDQSEDDQINENRKEESQRIIHLMRNTAEKNNKDEDSKNGLIILNALYGQMINDVPGANAYPVAGDCVIDVTIPMQTLVHDSQLRIYSTKDQLPGFYDPCPAEPKMLKVVYKFRNELHAVTVNDDQALNIPLKAHLVQG